MGRVKEDPVLRCLNCHGHRTLASVAHGLSPVRSGSSPKRGWGTYFMIVILVAHLDKLKPVGWDRV